MILDSVHFRMSNNFLGLHDEVSKYEDSKAVIIPVPYDSTTSYRAGTREGPAALIAASAASITPVPFNAEISTTLHPS